MSFVGNALNNIQFTSVNMVTFTSNGTYTPPSNLLYAQIECGGGGGGGETISEGSGSGGAGGSGGTGIFVVRGQDGNIGMRGQSGVLYIPNGGNSFLGWGAYQDIGRSTAGRFGELYGGGGAGGSSLNDDGAKAGGNGAQGVVVITEYLASS